MARIIKTWKDWLQGFQANQAALGCENPTAAIKRGNHHAGWRMIQGRRVYFRSKWEFNYGLYLQYQKEQGFIAEWEHEPKTFWFEKIKRGVRSYLPDFRVTTGVGDVFYVEVKGYMDSRSKTKLTRFKRYYPKETIELVTGKWFAANNSKMRAIIKEWE